MQFTTLFMSDEEKHGHYFDLPLYFCYMSKQFVAPGGLSAECEKDAVKKKVLTFQEDQNRIYPYIRLQNCSLL